MLVLELKSSQRHPPSPKELGETEVKSNKRKCFDIWHLLNFSCTVAREFCKMPVLKTVTGLYVLMNIPGYFSCLPRYEIDLQKFGVHS